MNGMRILRSQNRLSPLAAMVVGLSVFLGLQPFLCCFWLWVSIAVAEFLGYYSGAQSRVSPTVNLLMLLWLWGLELAAIAGTLTVIWCLARTRKVVAMAVLGTLMMLVVILGTWYLLFGLPPDLQLNILWPR